jgi:hypothetical protein
MLIRRAFFTGLQISPLLIRFAVRLQGGALLLGAIASLAALSCATGCAYHAGVADRQIPGGYRMIAVPVFKNDTAETGVEVFFTNALVRELERSRLAKVTDMASAEVDLVGVVSSIKYAPTNSYSIDRSNVDVEHFPAPNDPRSFGPNIATNTVQNTEYRILVTTQLQLVRISDHKVVWAGEFKNERTYLAPKIAIQDLTSANATYNQSARDQNLQLMAKDTMREAYERLTENF